MSELKVQIILEALDLATKNIEGVNGKVQDLKKALTTSEFTNAASGMERFGQAVDESTQPMADAAKTALGLAGGITAIVTALAGRFQQASTENEAAIADLAKVMDGGREAAEGYAGQLDEVAIAYGQNGQKLLTSMAEFKQSGYDAQAAYSLVQDAINMAISGQMEASRSSELLVSILKGFKAPATEAAHVVDLLNEVSNNYATDVEQLAQGMAALSPIANQMGFDLNETAGLLTPVIEVFRSGNEAADALKTGLQKLTDDSKPVTEALAQIGVSQRDANGALRSGKDIFLDVARAFETLDDSQRQYLTAQLVGIDQAGRMSTVLSNLSGYLAVTEAAAGSAGSAMREVGVRLETSEVKALRAEESFRQLSVTLGNQFRNEITGLISATGELAAAFDSATQGGGLEPLISALRPQITAVETLVRAMAGNLEEALAGVDWTPLVNGLRSVSTEFGEAFSQLTEGVDLTTVEGLRTVLDGVVVILGKLSEWIGGVIDGLGPLMGALNALFGVVSQGLPEISRLVGQVQGLALSANTLIPIIANVGSTVFDAIGTIAEFTFKITLAVTALRLLQSAGVPLGPMFASLTTALRALGPTVLTVVGRLTGLTVALKSVLAIGTFVIFEKLGTWLREASQAAEDFTHPLYLIKEALEGVDWVFSQLSESYRVQLEAEKNLQSTQERTAEILKRISDETGIVVTSMKELDQAVKDGKIVWDETAQTWTTAKEKIKDFSAANRDMIEASDQQLAIAEALREQFAALGLVYDSTTGKIGDQTKAVEQSADQIEKETDRRVTHLRLLQLEAEARGDTATAARIAAQINDESIAGLERLLGVKEAELAALRQTAQAKLDEADADAIRTAAELSGIDATSEAVAKKEQEIIKIREAIAEKQKELSLSAQVVQHQEQIVDVNQRVSDSADAGADSNEKLADSMESVGDAADVMRKMVDDALASLAQYSKGAAAAVDEIVHSADNWINKVGQIRQLEPSDFISTDGLDAAKQELADLTAAADAAQASADAMRKSMTKAFDWWGPFYDGLSAIKELEAGLLRAEAAAKRLEIAAAELDGKLSDLADAFDAGDVGLTDYLATLEQLRRQYSRLSDDDLDALEDKIRDVKDALKDQADTAVDGLNSWRVKLAGIYDQEIQIQQLNWQQDRLEAELALQEARRNGNAAEIAALQEQLRLIDEYYQYQLKVAAEQEAADAIAAADEAAAEAARFAGLSDEERKYEETLARLKARLAQAILDQDAVLQASILAQIEAEKARHQQVLADLEKETKAKQSAANDSGSTESSSATQSARAASAAVLPVRVVEVRVSMPSGDSGTVQVVEGSESTLEALLKSLEKSKLVA